MTKQTDTFCILPWIHLNITPSGLVKPCCMNPTALGNLRNETLSEISNNDAIKAFRKDIMNGVVPDGCERCAEREVMGITSMRQSKNEIFKHHIDNVLAATDEDMFVNDFKLHYWDFRFSNLCNMKCRMCGPHFSSMWYNDEIKLYGRSSIEKQVLNANDDSKDNLLDMIDEHINDVEYIYFAGGEPLIMDEHYYILDKLIKADKTDVQLRYNTNLLKLSYKKWNVIDLWKQFDSVQLNCSIDSFGDRLEYIRHGAVWNTLKDNMKQLMDNDFKFSIEVTTNVFNTYTLVDFINELTSMGIPLHKIMLHNILQYPEYYHSALMTDTMKEDTINSLTNFMNSTDNQHIISGITSVINNMNKQFDDKELLLQKFRKKTKELDTIRGESFTDTFPELSELLKDNNE